MLRALEFAVLTAVRVRCSLSGPLVATFAQRLLHPAASADQVKSASQEVSRLLHSAQAECMWFRIFTRSRVPVFRVPAPCAVYYSRQG